MNSKQISPHEPETTRRGFLKIAIGTLAGVVTVFLGIPLAASVIGPAMRREQATLSRVGEISRLPVGEPTLVTFPADVQDAYLRETTLRHMWVVKESNGDVRVYSPICPHLGCEYQWEGSARQFVCPCHVSVFDINGKVLAGPSPRALDTLHTTIQGDVLFVQWERFKVGISQKIPA